MKKLLAIVLALGLAVAAHRAAAQAVGGRPHVFTAVSVGGTANAQTVTTSGGFNNTVMDMVCANFTTPNTASATLAVDGAAALPVQAQVLGGLRNLAANELAGYHCLMVSTGATSFVLDLGPAANAGCPSIIGYGGKGDGTSDNMAAWAAAVAANPAKMCLSFPAGGFVFSSPLSFTGALMILGAGQGITALYFPNSAGGIAVTLTTNAQAVAFAGFDITTGVAGGGSAFSLTGPPIAGYNLNPVNSFTNLSIHGNDGYSGTYYWNTGISVTSLGNINYVGVTIVGDGAFHATGLKLQGTTTVPSMVHNIIGSNFMCLNTGLIYGSYVQGVTVTGGSNFVCGNTGISVPAGGLGLDQLTIGDSSFNQTQYGININSGVNGLAIHDNVFIPNNGAGGGVDLRIGTNMQGTITHNNFQAGGSGSVGIDYAASAAFVVAQNGFAFTPTGIKLEAGSAGMLITDDNLFGSGVTTPILELSTFGANQINGAKGFTPTLVGSTSNGTPTYTAQIGGYYRTRTNYTLNFEVAATAMTGLAGNVSIGIPFTSNPGGAIYNCSLQPGGVKLPTGYTMVTGQIAPGKNTIDLYVGPSATGGLISLDAATMLNGALIQLLGQCSGVF